MRQQNELKIKNIFYPYSISKGLKMTISEFSSSVLRQQQSLRLLIKSWEQIRHKAMEEKICLV